MKRKAVLSHDECQNAVLKFEEGSPVSCVAGGRADMIVLKHFGRYNVPDGTVIEVDDSEIRL